MSSFRASHSGGLTQRDVKLSHGRAACWVVVTDNQRYAYVTNTLSSNDGGPTNGVGTGHGAVTSFSVASNGTLTYVASTDTSHGFPSDEALSTDSRYLYVLVPAVFPPGIFPFPLASTIDAFRVGSHGSLTSIGSFTSPEVLASLGASGIGAY